MMVPNIGVTSSPRQSWPPKSRVRDESVVPSPMVGASTQGPAAVISEIRVPGAL